MAYAEEQFCWFIGACSSKMHLCQLELDDTACCNISGIPWQCSCSPAQELTPSGMRRPPTTASGQDSIRMKLSPAVHPACVHTSP